MDPHVLADNYITLCTIITVTAAVVTIISNVFIKAKEPDRRQDDRITELEKRIGAAETKLASDKTHFDEIEQGTRIMQQSLLALMSHAIDGNDVDKLRDARDQMQKYLIEK
jgi:hypothetical protein